MFAELKYFKAICPGKTHTHTHTHTHTDRLPYPRYAPTHSEVNYEVAIDTDDTETASATDSHLTPSAAVAHNIII